MSRYRTGLVFLVLLGAFALPVEAWSQQAPSPCESPECCKAADGAELVGQVGPVGDELGLRAARVKFRFSHPANAEAARTTSFRTSADSAGRYRVCGIPTPVEVEATARAAGAASQTVTFTLSKPERLTLNFTLEPIATPEKVADSLRGALPTVPEGEERSVLAGRLLDDETGRTIADATVRLTSLDRGAVTGAQGRFRIKGVPPGEYKLQFSHIRYGSRTVNVSVPERGTVALDIRIPPEAIELEPVEVTVESELRLRRLEDGGFYHRRERGFGHFFGPQYLTKWSGTRLPTILARTPGIRIQKGQGLEYIIQNDRCLGGRDMAVYVDGVKWSTLPNFTLTELAAVEVYKSPAQSVAVPFQGSGCGLLLIWTWHGPNPFHDSAADGYACPERLKRFRSHAC